MINHADNEDLVQRFVDQELTPEERVQFLSRIGRDESLRRRAIDLEQLVLDAGRLPRPAMPDGFAASVMRKLPDVPPNVAPIVAPSFSSATMAVTTTGLSSWR